MIKLLNFLLSWLRTVLTGWTILGYSPFCGNAL